MSMIPEGYNIILDEFDFPTFDDLINEILSIQLTKSEYIIHILLRKIDNGYLDKFPIHHEIMNGEIDEDGYEGFDIEVEHLFDASKLINYDRVALFYHPSITKEQYKSGIVMVDMEDLLNVRL